MTPSRQRGAARTRTLYMHTFDGKPATSVWYLGGDFVFTATPRGRIRMETSLKSLRRTQKRAREHAAKLGGHEEFAVASRYGYRLVEVPQ